MSDLGFGFECRLSEIRLDYRRPMKRAPVLGVVQNEEAMRVTLAPPGDRRVQVMQHVPSIAGRVEQQVIPNSQVAVCRVEFGRAPVVTVLSDLSNRADDR